MIISKTKTTKRKLAKKLGISVSSLYYKPKREIIDNEIKSQIEAVLTDNPAYGHKRIALALKLNKKRILRVMHKFNIKPYRRRRKRLRKKNDLKKPATKYLNLIENIVINKPHQVWATDFTYIKWQNRFIYLSTIMDVYSRCAVGFNISRFHNKELVIGALENALTYYQRPEIIHSDQGSEYDSQAYSSFCEQLSIKISMSRKSSPWENAFQESFYSHFKVDIADVNRFQDITELIEEINYQIWYYNNERIHGRIKTTPKNRLENYCKLRGT